MPAPDKIMLICVSVLLSFYMVGVLKFYLDTFLRKTSILLHELMAWSVFFIWQLFIDQHTAAFPPWVNILVTMAAVELVVILAYRRMLWKHLFFDVLIGLAFVVLWMLAEPIAYICLHFIIKAMPPVIIVSIISKVLLLVAVAGIHKFAIKKKLDREKLEQPESLLMIPVLSIIFYSCLYMLGNHAGAKVLAGMLILAILLFTSNLYVYPLYARRLNEAHIRANMRNYIQQLEACMMQEHERETDSAEIHQILHNRKQTLLYLHQLAVQDGSRLVKDELAKLLDLAAEHEKASIDTGNAAINAILKNKWHEAKQQGICLNENIRVLGDTRISNMDLSVLLGNALDNACEAVAKLTSNKEIWLTLEIQKGVFKMTVRNPYEGEIKWLVPQRQIKSVKKTGRHGMGLPSMHCIVDKYHGTMKIKTEGQWFVLEVGLMEESL